MFLLAHKAVVLQMAQQMKLQKIQSEMRCHWVVVKSPWLHPSPPAALPVVLSSGSGLSLTVRQLSPD